MIHDLFKVPIYQVQLNLDNQKLHNFCKKHQTKNSGRVFSNVGGYQSNELDLNKSTLSPLLKEIQNHSNIFVKEFASTNKISLSEMWTNINSYGDTNISHCHPGSTISGVYYVKTPNECGNIVFESPAKTVLNYYNNKRSQELNAYNASDWWLPSNESILYLFPGWLNHYEEPNLNKTEERISFSFNAY